MSANDSVPYGLKSLLECMSRATLLAQPGDIPEFLSSHVDGMTHFRDKDSRDAKEVAFRYQEQWENSILLKERKRTTTPRTASEESPSLTSSVSRTSSASLTVAPRCELRRRTRRESSVRISHQQEGVGIASEEIHPSSPPRPAPAPCGERVKTRRVSSVRIPCQKKTKPSLPSSRGPVLPSIPQKAPSHVSKRVQRQKPTKGRGSGVYTCHLNDCPYHTTPKEGSAVDRELGPVRTSEEPTVKRDLGLQKSLAGPASFELRVPYKPKGGPVVDPELVPKRTRARLVTTGTESSVLCGRQSTVYAGQDAVSEGTNLSLKCLTQTCTELAHAVHIICYRCMHVQCRDLQPHSARLQKIVLQRNLESQFQQLAKSSTPCDPIRNCSAIGKSPPSLLSDWNQF